VNWQIHIPHHGDRDAPLTDVGFDARHLEDPEDRAVTREFVLDSMLDSGLETVGDLIDMLSNAGPAQRRELLNKCRLAAGLETVEDVEGHARFVQANEALLYRPHRPVPSCAVCGAHPTTPQGMPDPNIPAVRRWHCREHVHLAQPGDMQAPPSPIDMSMRYVDPDEIAREQRQDERRAEEAERRRRDREAEAEATRAARRRYEESVAEDDYVRPLIAGIRGVRMDAP
jgi:hypothetical protein